MNELEPPCPRCGEPAAIPILYGMPSGPPEVIDGRPEFITGGCVVMEGAPTHECARCGRPFGHLGLTRDI